MGFSPIRLKGNVRNSMDGGNVSSRVMENFNRYSALNLSGRKEPKSKDALDTSSSNSKVFERYSALNLSGRKEAKEMKVKIDNLKSNLTKDINTIRDAFTSLSSPQSYKRKQSNLINEDREGEGFAAVDLTIDLCDTIKHDDENIVDIPIVKKRKLFAVEDTEPELAAESSKASSLEKE